MVKEGRVRGFELPLSGHQMVSWVGNAFVTGMFYALNALVLFGPWCEPKMATTVVLVVHLVLVVGGLVCWLFLEWQPPSRASCISLGGSARWKKTRYCREHKETIQGLDHFCTWLNVAIGANNYLPFYCLALFGTAQYALHAGLATFLAITCDHLVARSLFGLAALLGFALLCAYVALLSFHTYLAFQGMGTYDWILTHSEVEPSQEMTKKVQPGHDRRQTTTEEDP